MRDVLVENTSWIETLSDVEVADPQATARPLSATKAAIRHIAAAVPRSWIPVARRRLTGVSARLPVGLRKRLNRVLSLMSADMGSIERDYPVWIELYDRADVETRRGIVAEIARMKHPPLISVLMPVFDPSPECLLAAIHSVRDQYYPWWELCIGDDASTNQEITNILRDAAASDHRIKLVRRAQNGHISAASNSALRLAAGSFIALLDHDDVLPPNALYEVAARIVAQPDIDIIYSDEDHIDDHGRRSQPYFKPDWNPELILGQNLISHLGVYRRTLMERIGGFRTGFEGSQDHDLALRIVAQTSPERIVHIPKVLYHWRQGASDQTFSEAAHERCVVNGRRAVYEFVTHDQPEAKVGPAPVVPSWSRVIYPVPATPPMVSVILCGIHSTGDILFDRIDKLLKRTGYPALEVLVAADAAGLPHRLADDPRVRCVGNHLTPNKLAAQEARGRLLLMLDAGLDPAASGWLREMVSHALRPAVGAVGAKLLAPEGTVRHAGIALGGSDIAFFPFTGQYRARAGYFGYLQLVRNVTAVSSACLLVRRDVFLESGGFDEALPLPVLKDVDLCLKLASAGYRSVWTPYAELYFRDDAPPVHADTAPFATEMTRMRERWGIRLDSDPCWSPNLACNPDEIGLAFPPRALKKSVSMPQAVADASSSAKDVHGCPTGPLAAARQPAHDRDNWLSA